MHRTLDEDRAKHGRPQSIVLFMMTEVYYNTNVSLSTKRERYEVQK